MRAVAFNAMLGASSGVARWRGSGRVREAFRVIERLVAEDGALRRPGTAGMIASRGFEERDANQPAES